MTESAGRDSAEPSRRSKVRRHADRAGYDRATVNSILDEGFICHVACAVDGTVSMIPTAYGRDGDRLLLHGAAGNHVLNAAAEGAELTVAVTLVDGMVLARSTFNTSINYRSVVLFASGTEVTDPVEKTAALATITEHMLPGRSAEARPPSPIELTKTRVIAVPIDEASAKVRAGGVADQPEDLALPVWAGVLPLHLAAGPVRDDDQVLPDGAPRGVPEPGCLTQPGRWTRDSA
jgi:nitroimidazol reductase NimA-like FMN-containing flavoprotein (pyridoxamine 5'-phosphate oxidase superfamily)